MWGVLDGVHAEKGGHMLMELCALSSCKHHSLTPRRGDSLRPSTSVSRIMVDVEIDKNIPASQRTLHPSVPASQVFTSGGFVKVRSRSWRGRSYVHCTGLNHRDAIDAGFPVPRRLNESSKQPFQLLARYLLLPPTTLQQGPPSTAECLSRAHSSI